jgi:hypothetical protein
VREKEFYEIEVEETPAPAPPRAPAWLAIMRIVCVLGMSFGIALGIFLLLGAWWIPGLIALVAAVPFLVVMRYFEKYASAHGDDAPPP